MKGISVVEHIARRFPGMTMLMAVRGPIPEVFRKLPNVRVLQDASYDSLPILYNAVDFSVCPSRYDPFPFVVSEALASGRPVICSPHGASLTFYDNAALKPLLAASTDDLEGFEQAVTLVVSDPEGWRRLVQDLVRPRLEELMAPENWWKRFNAVVGIEP
jgi:glycosyltransferase involved in cell wall biosynthesis